MKLQYDLLKEIENEAGSSFYLMDVNKLRDNYMKIHHAFQSRYSNFIIGYSYKTNYLPFLCKEIMQLGGYAEVVSRLEYELALKVGVDPRKIIFNGPLKTYHDIETALFNDSIINLESFYEIEFLNRFCIENREKLVKIGLRVNFDISNGEESPLQEGFHTSRFGICALNGDLQEAINKIKKLDNVRVIGFHGHFSTKERKIETYKNITKGLCKLAKQYIGDTIEYIDIGGGIYGELPPSFHLNTPSFEDYAEAVCTIMNTEFKDDENPPFLILEPGISMVANTFTFIAKVIDRKRIQDKHFVLIDGSVHNIKPTMHKRNLPMQIVRQRNSSTEHQPYNIVGYTCMEKDYLAHEVEGTMPSKDDYIVFENVGAYTIVFNPPFIKERPAIVAIDNNEMMIVRKKESFNEFFNKELYVF